MAPRTNTFLPPSRNPNTKSSRYMHDTSWSLFPKIAFISTGLISPYWLEMDAEGSPNAFSNPWETRLIAK